MKSQLMNRIFGFLFILLLFSCDDGDLITLALEFDKSLERCGDEDSDSYLIYDVKNEDAFESLIVVFGGGNNNDLLFDPEENPYTRELTINGTTNRFNYRIYNGDPLGVICQDIPDASVSVIEDYEATSGTIIATSTFIDDDNDGVPTTVEDANLDGDNDPTTDPTDTDGDGIPDFKDFDDDNDNVPTADENPDPDADGDVSDAQDTDADGIPDYLDDDDDGDGTITRYEDENGNNNPIDDFEVGSVVPRYLDPLLSDVFVNDNTIDNQFRRTITVAFEVQNVNIEVLSADELDLGTFVLERDF